MVAIADRSSDNAVATVLNQHSEALVVFTDVVDGEIKISVATKMDKHDSRLSAYLSRVLASLTVERNEKHSCGQSPATDNPQSFNNAGHTRQYHRNTIGSKKASRCG